MTPLTPKPDHQQQRATNRSRFAAVALFLTALILVGAGLAANAFGTLFPAFVAVIFAMNLRRKSPAIPKSSLSAAQASESRQNRHIQEGQMFGTGHYAFLGEDLSKD